ncbi:MAG: hypothetical protein MHPSP_000901, partial [Paramarteilia canceri]
MAKVLAKLSNDSCESVINELISTCNENDYPLESLTHGADLGEFFLLLERIEPIENILSK